MTSLPTPDRSQTLEVEGGSLYVEHFAARTPATGTLVLVHGFAVHCGLYREPAAMLASRGLSVTMFDCRGHGQSSGRRGHVGRFHDYGADLQAVIGVARSWSSGPLILMGHSHGGTIALDSVLRGVVTPERLVLAAPWLALKMGVPWYKRAAAPLLSRLAPGFTLPNGIRAADCSQNPATVATLATDPLIHHVASARWFSEVLAAQARIAATASTLRVPTLLLAAGQDKIVSTDAALAFAEQAGGLVTVRRYEALYHDLFLELDRDRVLVDIARWLSNPPASIDDSHRDLGRARPAESGIL